LGALLPIKKFVQSKVVKTYSHLIHSVQRPAPRRCRCGRNTPRTFQSPPCRSWDVLSRGTERNGAQTSPGRKSGFSCRQYKPKPLGSITKDYKSSRFGRLRYGTPVLLANMQAQFTVWPVKVLFIGDIVGAPCRAAVSKLVPGLR